MGLLEGKKIVITGVLTDASLAFGVARIALEQGAEIVLTGAGRALSLTQRTARKLGDGLDVFEFDVTVPEHVESVREAVADKWGRVDGVLHSIGFAPASCLGDDFFGAPWEDVATAIHISTYSLKTLADAFVPLMGPGGAFVGLDFDNQRAWPAYNWMGVAKSALQSVNRYLARELGPQADPMQPGRRRAGAHDGRQVDPRLRAVRGHVGRPRPARLGRQQLRAGRQGVRRPAVRLVPGHDRRDRPRRRRATTRWVPRYTSAVGSDRDPAQVVDRERQWRQRPGA